MTKKILVVDDDLQSLKLVGLVLQRRGYEIIAAKTGAQALERIETQEPDLIVLDVMMPDMDGYEVCRRIRTDPETADLPVIMFTAKADVQDKVTGFEAGADDYLTKPIHPKELVSRVEVLLLRSARARPKEETPQANVIGFLGSKGGIGTTTLAVNAALILARGPAKGQRVVLAEMRSGIATASLQLGIPSDGGILRLLDQPIGQIERGLIEAQLDEHTTGLLLLSGQIEPPGVARPIPPDHAGAIVRHLGAVADHVYLDLGVGLGETNQRLLPRCRHVVVTVEPNQTSLTLAQTLLDQMSQSLNVPGYKTSLVLINKSRSATSFTKRDVEELMQHTVIGVVPPAPELAFQSAKERKPMVVLQPGSVIAQQIKTIVTGLMEA